jgi:hypothetical protein
MQKLTKTQIRTLQQANRILSMIYHDDRYFEFESHIHESEGASVIDTYYAIERIIAAAHTALAID